jgi:hypothetical protein
MAVETVHAHWVEENVFLLRDHFGFPNVTAGRKWG